MPELERFVREVAAQLRLMRRNPFSVLFTVALPLLLVPLLHALNQGSSIFLGGVPSSFERIGSDAGLAAAPADQYFVPAVAAFAVASACFGQLAVRVAVAREQGILKRLRGTPASPATHLAARVTAPMLGALLVVAAALALGAGVYDLTIPSRSLVPVIAITLLGAATCSALGLVATRIATTADAAPAVVYAVLIPVAFVSSTFFPPYLAPEWMHNIGAWLPLQPFVSALASALNPAATGFGASTWDLGRLGAWGVGGAVVATRVFSWSPADERPPRDARVRAGIAVGVVLALMAIVLLGGRDRAIRTGVRVDALKDGVPTQLNLLVDLPDDKSGPVPMTIVLIRHAGTGAVQAFEVSTACGLTRAADVDPAWLAAIASKPATAELVDLCGAVAFTAAGRCITPCSGALPSVGVHVGADGRISIDKAKAGPSVGYPERSALLPYLLADGKPAALSETADEIAIGATGFRLRVGTNAGGTINLVRIEDSASAGPLELPLSGLRWLSLPVGGTDASGDDRSSHPSPGLWIVESPLGTLRLEGAGPVLSWDQVHLVVTLTAGSYQRDLVLRKP